MLLIFIVPSKPCISIHHNLRQDIIMVKVLKAFCILHLLHLYWAVHHGWCCHYTGDDVAEVTCIHYALAKADRRPWEKKKFYHQFSIVKYSYLPTDTFRKYVERHVTWSKLTLKFTGYCRQTSYTDSTVIHTLVPAVA